MPLLASAPPPQPRSFTDCWQITATDSLSIDVPPSRANVLDIVAGGQRIRSCSKCAAATEGDASPWFSRTSCSCISSREEEENTRKRSGENAR